jgi:hypothetical protein
VHRRYGRAVSAVREAERLRGLETNDQFELGRQFDRILALEDAINVSRRAPIHVDIIHAVGHQAAAGQKETIRIDGGQRG